MIKNTLNFSCEIPEKETIDEVIENLTLIRKDMQKINANVKVAYQTQIIFYATNEEAKNDK